MWRERNLMPQSQKLLKKVKDTQFYKERVYKIFWIQVGLTLIVIFIPQKRQFLGSTLGDTGKKPYNIWKERD
jgi:hypothetical protein